MTIYHKNGTIITVQYASIEAAVKAGVSLTGANLTDANLAGADLTGADLRDANLTGANLTDAVLYVGNRRITL